MLKSLALVLFVAAPVGASSLGSFHYTGAAEIHKTAAPVPLFKAVAADRMDKAHLLAQAGNDTLLGYAKTQAQYEEAVAYWTGVLSAAGLSVGEASLKNDMYLIPYTSSDGKNVRRFVADSKQFKPKDEAALRENMSAATAALGAAGLSVLTTHVLDLEYMLPTYAVYYLTEKRESREREEQIRILARGTDIDWDIVEGAVNIVQRPRPWMMVYIGREIGQVGKIGKTLEEITKKLEEQRAWLVERGAVMIGSRIRTLDPADQWDGYRYISTAYFYR